MQNFILILGVAILAFILYRRFAFTTNKNIQNVTADEAHQLIKTTKNLIILDVRSKQEFKSGHIPSSKSIPVGELSSRINELEKYKDNPILVHCASGGRSPAAVRVLLKHNFSKIYHMNRGLSGWKYGLK
ncbi:rhodanese-like domain-containing protein [Clostridium aciditolerans]|uniref:Rhodanese-like domain-containing protein n=1 Tax=Clostridium aciditolerans TaxID=339861 RepID=A0A934HYC8_9CLOT|nr:rhodanese-like domain-containing protein [Clostridium aciditolerans]MBI6871781.1 rhodanese-like domain-containing protein [Clostridium aciditolerans]